MSSTDLYRTVDPFGNILELCEIPVEEENPTTLPGVSTLGTYPQQES